MQHILLPAEMEAQTPFDIDPHLAASFTDRIWQDAVPQFSFTGNELLLPFTITATIGMMNLERLKTQLSSFLGRPCVALLDNKLGCIRILACPEYRGIGNVDDHIVGRESQVEQAMAHADHTDKKDEKNDRQNENNVKAPRPPNAFILYRKHHHTILKQKNPAIHNNQISVTVGNQWNNESAEVKAHFKAMADKAKREHAAKYPGYQYAPRKPSEKKRRNSRRRSRTEQPDYDTLSGEDEEGSSPQTSGASNLFAASYNEDFDRNIDDLLPFANIPAAPVENYEFTDFEMGEYDYWVDVAAHAQEAAIIANSQPHGHGHFHAPIRLTNIA